VHTIFHVLDEMIHSSNEYSRKKELGSRGEENMANFMLLK
jgi:hypothetical protein